jgi:hypothetical protein
VATGSRIFARKRALGRDRAIDRRNFDDAESIQDSRNFARKTRQSDPRESAFGHIASVVRFATALDYDRRFVETQAVAVEDERWRA